MRVFLKFRESKPAFIFHKNCLLDKDIKMFYESLIRPYELFMKCGKISRCSQCGWISIVYSPKHLISWVFCALCFCALLCVHFLLGISTTTNPSLPKYGDIDVLVNHLCLIIGLGGLVWLLTQLIQGEGQKARFTSLSKYCGASRLDYWSDQLEGVNTEPLKGWER